MIWITGDTHGDFDRIEEFVFDNEMSREDILILLGDACINFYLSEEDRALKERLANLPITLLCIHGNHEERPYNVDGYEETEWHGGIAYIDPRYENQVFAMDGEIYDLEGYSCLAIGGAYSVDKYANINGGGRWFEDEQPTDEIMDHVEENLKDHDWCVDIVLSHTCPMHVRPRSCFLSGVTYVDTSTEEWLEEISEKLDFDRWFFGHYHDNQEIDEKYTLLYDDYREL